MTIDTRKLVLRASRKILRILSSHFPDIWNISYLWAYQIYAIRTSQKRCLTWRHNQGSNLWVCHKCTSSRASPTLVKPFKDSQLWSICIWAKSCPCYVPFFFCENGSDCLLLFCLIVIKCESGHIVLVLFRGRLLRMFVLGLFHWCWKIFVLALFRFCLWRYFKPWRPWKRHDVLLQCARARGYAAACQRLPRGAVEWPLTTTRSGPWQPPHLPTRLLANATAFMKVMG